MVRVIVFDAEGVLVSPMPVTFANPKSRIFACPRSLTKMLAGLMSRWMIPLQCAASSASAISMASENFGTEGLHRISDPLYVSLSNTGTAALSVSSIGSTSSEYSPTNNCPISPNTLASGGGCLITVRFTPSAVGTRTGRIIIRDNAEGSPQTINLTGNGVISHVSLSTTSLMFGVQLLGTTSASKIVKLTNTSAPTVVNTSGIVVSGDFILASTPNQCPSNGSVAPKSNPNAGCHSRIRRGASVRGVSALLRQCGWHSCELRGLSSICEHRSGS